MEKNASSQLYGTYFGNIDNQPDVGDHVDGGTSRYDKEGVIYEAMCANCGKIGSFPTSPGNVWGPSNAATVPAYCNEAAVKIAFEFAGVGSMIRVPSRIADRTLRLAIQDSPGAMSSRKVGSISSVRVRLTNRHSLRGRRSTRTGEFELGLRDE